MPAPDWIPRLVALDIDETLLRPGLGISPAVRSAVHRVVRAGTEVVLATGRTALGTRPIVAGLGLAAGHVLCSNGSVRLDAATGEAVHMTPFDPGPVLHRLAELLPGAVFGAELVGIGNLVTAHFGAYGLTGEFLAGLDEVANARTPRLTVWWPGRNAEEMNELVADLELPGASFTVDHVHAWLTAVAPGVSKGGALEQLRTELKVPVDSTMAVGDGYNDVEMLRWAAHGVAMGQAPPDVRAVADEVTGTVQEDGLVTALDRWFSLPAAG
ncbi:haloacid dehalogenase [Longimycelium tulufanense]|uniref:Haloacid dehalogenase n=1 Tax=Longimycelium tulufanense TaxID=907463 RepID=A0A8J3CEI4_9PSEU|nr:HAD-IIB family hydrolase [Longimycelium tulufanense]GGM67354.1 haloacid dehalogenase [Longimycelium tulufanense]